MVIKAIAMVAGVLLEVQVSLAGTDCNAVLLFQCPYPCGATIQTCKPSLIFILDMPGCPP